MVGARISSGEEEYRKILRDSSHDILKQPFQTLQKKNLEIRRVAERTSKMTLSLERILASLT